MIDKSKQFARVSLKGTEKLELIGSFATMISSGVSILEMVKSLAEDTKGGQRIILDEMREDLTQGKHIYVTFGKFPRVFDRVSINVIRASEAAGTLDLALRDLRQNPFRSHVSSFYYRCLYWNFRDDPNFCHPQN